MSDQELNKADGCDVFFSVIIALVLLSGFVVFQYLAEPAKPLDSDYQIDKTRLEKIESHKKVNSLYNTKIEKFHSENNSSMESVMNKVISTYSKK
jgi:hypothetical protein